MEQHGREREVDLTPPGLLVSRSGSGSGSGSGRGAGADVGMGDASAATAGATASSRAEDTKGTYSAQEVVAAAAAVTATSPNDEV